MKDPEKLVFCGSFFIVNFTKEDRESYPSAFSPGYFYLMRSCHSMKYKVSQRAGIKRERKGPQRGNVSGRACLPQA